MCVPNMKMWNKKTLHSALMQSEQPPREDSDEPLLLTMAEESGDEGQLPLHLGARRRAEAMGLTEEEYLAQSGPADIEEQLGAVTSILQPVTLCLTLVVLYILLLPSSQNEAFNELMVRQESPEDSAAAQAGSAIINALVILGVIVVSTFVLVLCYKFHCVKLIVAWLFMAVALMLFVMTLQIWNEIWLRANLALDIITMLFSLWNFAIVGCIAIFWRSPPKVTQFYLLVASVLVATSLIQLPEWTTWAILVFLALWDVIAVLTPKGPLRVLVEMSEERGDPIPALVYSGGDPNMIARETEMDGIPLAPEEEVDGIPLAPEEEVDGIPLAPEEEVDGIPLAPEEEMMEMGEEQPHQPIRRLPAEMAHEGEQPMAEEPVEMRNEGDLEAPQQRQPQEEEEEEDYQIRLGLGDFIFYSVLVGRASMSGLASVWTTFVAVVMGLVATLYLLAVHQKALPALPISIVLGTAAFFVTRFVVYPYAIHATMDGVLIL